MVNKFLELLGVDLDEDFLLSGVLGNPFRFQMTDDFFTLIDTFGSDCWEYVSEMLIGKYEVIKLGGEEVIDMSLETLGGEEVVDKFLEMLGVELGEKFNLVFSGGGERFEYSPYHFEGEDGCFNLYDRIDNESNQYISDIISGYFEIKKLPWKPKDGDNYWFVHPKGHLVSAYFCEEGMVDLYNFNTGNCFKTEKEAEAHKDEIIRQFKEIKKELNA